MSTTLTSRRPENAWMDDPATDPSWRSPCPIWCTSFLTDSDLGHSGDDVPLHSGTIGTVVLDGVLYAALVQSSGDGPPEVSMVHDGSCPADLDDMSAEAFLSLAPVLLSRFEKTLASLYRDMAARVRPTAAERAALLAEAEARRAAERAEWAAHAEERAAERAAEQARIRAEYVDVDSCPTCGHLPCCAEHYIPHAPNTVPLYGPQSVPAVPADVTHVTDRLAS